jgi:hypothetical protein
MNRESLIVQIAERLEVFAAVLAVRKRFTARNGDDRAGDAAIQREHAARIVDAVLVLSQEDRDEFAHADCHVRRI